MKMKKTLSKIWILFIFCLFVMAMIATSAITVSATETGEVYSGACGTGITWEVNTGTGTLVIRGNGAINTYSKGSAPWYKYRDSITKIEVANSITSISASAFYGCNSLKELTIPFVGGSQAPAAEQGASCCSGYDNRKYVLGYIFGWYEESTSLLVTGTVYQGYGYYSAPNSIGVTASYDTTGDRGCNSYYLVSNYTRYYADYFYIPSSLTKVTVTGGNTIAYGAFHNCTQIKEIVLPSTTTSIGANAFRNCTKLEVFSLPSSLTALGHSSFYNCDALVEIEIPSGISVVGIQVFYDCDALTNIKFHANITSINRNSFYSCGKLKSIHLPENLKTIDESAFSNCSSLTNIVIPNNVTTIGESAFKGCSNVLTVTIGDSVSSIGEEAFYNLSKIEKLVVPKSVTSIGAAAFYGCNSLKELTIPFVGGSQAPAAEQGASYCSGYDNRKYVLGYIFGWYEESEQYNSKLVYQGYGYYSAKTSSGTTASYPTDGEYGKNSYYLVSNYTRYYADFFYIPSSLTKVTVTGGDTIAYGAFHNCTQIKEIILPSTIEAIGDRAFLNCGVINNSTDDMVISNHVLLAYKGTSSVVEIPSGIKVIGPRAFKGNTTLGSIKLADTTSIICKLAFNGCENAVIYVPRISGTLTIGTNAFLYTGSVRYLDKYSYTNGNDTFYYTIENGKAVIVGCSTTSTNITLPNTLGGYAVTSIGYMGMANCTTLKGVTIPNNIVKIDLYAFYGCTGLDTVTIPETCLYVGENAFEDCTSLTTVVIAEGVTYIGDHCFSNCVKLSKIVIPDSCTYLGEYSFYNCTSLASATIGITVPAINNYTFYNCKKLKTIVIGVEVASIGDYAFYNTAIERLTTPLSLEHIGSYAFASCNSLERVALKAGLLTIGEGAFYGDASLSTINWTANINSIGAYAFYGCSSLASASIPAGVSEINDYTFAYCSSLASITFKGTIVSIGTGAFYRDSLSEISFAEGLTSISSDAFAYNKFTQLHLPSSLTYIGEQAFDECNMLATISMPDSVSTVGAYAFSNNSSNLIVTIRYNSGKVADNILYNTDVYKVIMEEGITEIGNYSFALCHSLKEITFSETLKSIGEYAFYDNRGYAELTLPKTIETIGRYAFARGYQLVQINVPDSVKTIGEYAFYNCEAKNHVDPQFTIKFYYNSGVIASSILNGQHIHHIILDDNIHTVGNNAFSNCLNLQDIDMPDTISSFGANGFLNDKLIVMNIRRVDGLVDNDVYREKLSGVGTVNIVSTNIGSYAFYKNPTVTNVYLTGMTSIGEYAFSTNTGLQTVKIEGNVVIKEHAFSENSACQMVTITGNTEIGNYAFSNNILLTNATVSGTSNIGNYAFYNCNAMTTFTIDGTIERVGDRAFEGCKSLKAMTLPNTVNYIGAYAFYDCNSMKSINIPNGIDKILSHTFYGCASLGSILVPNSVNEIEDYAFYGCVVATNITLSNQCKTIGEAAFYNCKALTALEIPDSVASIGAYAFRSCDGITELVFSDNVDFLGECAFYDCSGLQTVKLGKKIIELGDRLFYGCVNLESLYIYAPQSYIDALAFYGADFVTIYCGYDEYMINYFDENGLSYVILDDLVYEYKITFITEDGEIISSDTYPSGTVLTPPTPTKPSDNVYKYVFNGWDQDITTVSGNKTYTASFTPVYVEYTVIFKDYDGRIISSNNYHYGDSIIVPENPTRETDLVGTYSFKSWDNEVVNCAGNVTYTAIYEVVCFDYTVIFKDEDGTVISTNTYHYGDTVAIPKTPIKEADNIYNYTFKGWDKTVVNCEGDATYTAVYNATYIEYTIVFKNYNGNTISQKTYHYGDSVNVPANPTKATDNTYTYTFAGWDKTVVNCVGDATYTATYTPTYIEYTVVFKDYDGDVISSNKYHYGDTVAVPSNPTRVSDVIGSYTFTGWDKEVVNCAGDTTYTAIYEISYIDYIVTFINYNGNVLSTGTYHYGDKVYLPETPTKSADNTYTYTFAGWDKEVVNCDGDAIYTATYTPVYIEYIIVFKDYDGKTISSKTYHYGDAITIPANPTRNEDVVGSYTFAGWDKTVVNCAGDTTYTATYSVDYTDYSVVFKNYNGTVISTNTYHYGDTVSIPSNPTKPADQTYTYTFNGWDMAVVNCDGNAVYTATYNANYINYTVIFKNDDGTVLSEKTYHYEDKVTVPNTPIKAADKTYTYTFAGWDKEVVNCDGDAIYTATYNSIYIDYAVIFKDEDGTILSEKTYHYGDKVTVPATPTKVSDNIYTYTFKSWNKAVVNCAGDATYTATYTSTYIDYTVIFKDEDGTILSEKTYHFGDKVIEPSTPTKTADNTYTYAFAGWDKVVVACDGNKTYTATYISTYVEYTVVLRIGMEK